MILLTSSQRSDNLPGRPGPWSKSRAFRGAMLVAVVAALFASSCSSDSSSGDGGEQSLTIVATTSIWADVAAAVAGDDATVEVLVPRGADPHGYQPSSRDVARL